MNDLARGIGRVGVLFGGVSSEREISLASGYAVGEALQRLSIENTMIDVADNLLTQLELVKPNIAFIALHGSGGEDGTIQGLLEYLRMPYTGSGVVASAVAMDKFRCKLMWRGSGLPTADFLRLDAESDWLATLEILGGEIVVKPCREGSSIGMTIVQDPQDLRDAWRHAKEFDKEVMAERRLTGDEYTVAILDGKALPAIRISTDSEFYDFNAKYHSNQTRYHCPSGLSKNRECELLDLCMEAFNSLDCRGWGRVDVMTDENGAFNLLEVNTVPGMTSHSLVPKAANSADISFDQLVLKIIEASL